ncbi:MAG: SPX domain-containing protein [Benjaminiella poitrasii]|nr:MAG: SPX domain-containing protein [Benjaminiella poitrasii]
MKFSKYLEDQSVPEWRKAYINYRSLKLKLKQVERFRRSKERKAALHLSKMFQEMENNNYYQYKPEYYKRPLFTAKRYSSTVNNKSHQRTYSRQESFKSSVHVLSILDEVLFYASSSERGFFHSLDMELDKISQFYNEKEKEAKIKLDALKVQMEFIAEYGRQLLNIGHISYGELASPEMKGHRRFYQEWFKYQDDFTASYHHYDFNDVV